MSQMMVVGVVFSRHGNTLDASRGRLLPSHNCEDDNLRKKREEGAVYSLMRKEKSS